LRGLTGKGTEQFWPRARVERTDVKPDQNRGLVERLHHVPNGEGWLLAVKQTYSEDRLRRDLRPVLIVPGYGMNAFIFGYHPTGLSMEAYWAQKGFEVWSVNFRGQGGSRCVGGRRDYGFEEAAVTDLGCVLDYVAARTKTNCDRVDAVGCSLGGTYLYACLTCSEAGARLGSIVAIGAPLEWRQVSPVFRAVFGSPRVFGRLRLRGIRRLARVAMPILTKAPRLLRLYLHPEIVDLSKMPEMIRTVETPNPKLNREIARWIRNRDLHVRGVNVTEALARVRNPLLVVLSNADGIVPESAALSAYERAGSASKEVLRVGTAEVPVAHADLFVSEISCPWVFEPLADWLERENQERPCAARGRRKPKGPGGRSRLNSDTSRRSGGRTSSRLLAAALSRSR
jgi:pimeloyl-ACP methyl ester carboxylesterase